MADKDKSRDSAQQVFRQFAWNLAGTLARRKAPVRRPRPARAQGAGR